MGPGESSAVPAQYAAAPAVDQEAQGERTGRMQLGARCGARGDEARATAALLGLGHEPVKIRSE